MKLIYGDRLKAALSRGEIVTTMEAGGPTCLDEVRVGLRLEGALISGMEDIDKQNHTPRTFTRSLFSVATIIPGQIYLGASVERLRVPRNVIGQMFTRSKFARLGVEFAHSSSFIFPGYGLTRPMPFIFEITTRACPIEIRQGEIYAFLVLFEIDGEVASKPEDAGKTRFPFQPGGFE